MLNYVFVAATWLIGAIGVGGAIAAVVACVVLGPATVIAIVEPIFARFIACTPCVVFVVFVLSTTGAYWVGHHQMASECHEDEVAAALQSKIDAANEDRDAARAAAADASLKLAAIQKQSEDDKERTDQYVHELENRPAAKPDDKNPCGLTDDDLRGMRATGPHATRKRSSTSSRWIDGARGSAGAKARR